MQNNSVLNEKEAASYIGMSVHFLRQARCYKPDRGPKFIKIERAVRYRVSDLDAFLEGREHGGDSSAR